MRASDFFKAVCCVFLLAAWSAALAANGPAKVSLPAVLPPQFAGWQLQGTAQTSNDPAIADPTNAAILKEYGFSDVSSATYTREDGRTLKIRAARFSGADGAFGAYTFYVQPEMTKEQIGDQGASLGQRVLFYRGHILVDASFSKESVMSGAELRELAGVLPRPGGSAANLPSFIEFMPRRGYVSQTQKYVMGPLALNALAAPVSADLVDFGASSEVTMGRYSTTSGDATLMLISYPTPQLAIQHLKRLDAAHPQAQSGVSTIENNGSFSYRRTGPLIVVVSGPVSDSDAKLLAGMVNYEASVTWNNPAVNQEVRDLTSLVLNVVILCAIVGGFAVIAGVAFGGVRILMKRLYPDKVFDRPEQMEFISLHLTETAVQGTQTNADVDAPAPQNPA